MKVNYCFICLYEVMFVLCWMVPSCDNLKSFDDFYVVSPIPCIIFASVYLHKALKVWRPSYSVSGLQYVGFIAHIHKYVGLRAQIAAFSL